MDARFLGVLCKKLFRDDFLDFFIVFLDRLHDFLVFLLLLLLFGDCSLLSLKLFATGFYNVANHPSRDCEIQVLPFLLLTRRYPDNLTILI